MEEITWNKYTDEKGIDQIEKIDLEGRISYVPNDPTNSDYQAYLNKDKAEQSTPIVIDEPATKSK